MDAHTSSIDGPSPSKSGGFPLPENVWCGAGTLWGALPLCWVITAVHTKGGGGGGGKAGCLSTTTGSELSQQSSTTNLESLLPVTEITVPTTLLVSISMPLRTPQSRFYKTKELSSPTSEPLPGVPSTSCMQETPHGHMALMKVRFKSEST